MKFITGLFLFHSIQNINPVQSRVSNWDIATCYQENQIIYAETNPRVVVSPNYPSTIPAGTNSCTYSLTARSSDSVITIDWKSFSLKEAPNCNQQKIIIIDEIGSHRVGPFCGSEASSFTSSGDKLKIQFIASSSGSQGSMFAFSFVAMDKMQMTQARSAFDAFDRARMSGGPRVRGQQNNNYGQFNSGNGGIENAMNAFDNIRQGRPINAAPLAPLSVSGSSSSSMAPTGRPLSSAATATQLSSKAEAALISSSGIRLGSALKDATKTSSKYNPENELNDNPSNNLNSHLKSVGSSDPKIVGNYQAKRTLKRYKDVQNLDSMAGIAQVKGKNSNNNDDFFSRSDFDEKNSFQTFGKTYRTQQEFDAAIEQEKSQTQKAPSIGPSRTDTIISSSLTENRNMLDKNIGSVSTADSTRKSGILLSDRFIPSSFISRGSQKVEGNTYLIKDRREGKLSDNEAMRDPIKEFFLEWNITKIFVAGLIGLIMLLIMVAFCRWRFNVWLQRREALRNSKLVQEVQSTKVSPESSTPAVMPTYKSVLKSIVSRDDDNLNNPDGREIIKNQEQIYIINSSNQSHHSSTPSCPITTSSDVPLSIKTSQTYIPGAVSIPISKIESMANVVSHMPDNFVDPNGVNPALEREKSRKHFLENQRSRNASRDSHLDNSNVNYNNSVIRNANIPTFLPAQDLTRNVTLIRNGSIDVNSAYPQHTVCPTRLPLPEVPSNSSKLANISARTFSSLDNQNLTSGSSSELINNGTKKGKK